MKILPLASESLGVRSLATYVETDSHKILIDPSAALGPSRYGLPPAKEELIALEESKKKIKEFARKADILIITHYHYDHYDPDENFYNGKKVLAKDINSKINKSQTERGTVFRDIIKDSCDLIYADNKKFNLDDIEIKFSEPFPHGPVGSRLGFVIMCSIIDKNFKLLFASDTQGPVSDEATGYILNEKPDLLIIDGPPTYFLGYKFSERDFLKSKENLTRISTELNSKIILDHHLLRDLKYKERFKELYETNRVCSMAEYVGLENNLLEAHRKELWSKAKI